MTAVRPFLRGLPVFAGELPAFDPAAAAEQPADQFLEWLQAALEAGVREPHAMILSTVDSLGLPTARTLILKNVDESGWQFAGQKGHITAAALTFYWPSQGRQIRVRGPVVAESAELSAADLRARSASAQAEALLGRQGQPLSSTASPSVIRPWTLYTLRPVEVEFFQADRSRKHTRLQYRRTEGTWQRRLLWP